MSSKAPLVHPFTFFIVNALTEAWINAVKSNLRDSAKTLYWLSLSLDAKGQTTLEKEITALERFIDGKDKLMESAFREVYRKVTKELHEEGYFLAAKMRPPTRERGMHDLEMRVDKAIFGEK